MSKNRLATETSPYLLQHKDNPVHWWPFGSEAFAHARHTGRPVLLSIGYAACHWCHVMAHESFEDDHVAAVMNALFVNIKVDREERPDVDQIYMSALHHFGEQGGWPLTMFLNADGTPFWGGTYFPKNASYGRPGFVDVMRQVARIHAESPQKVHANGAAILARLTAAAAPQVATDIGLVQLDVIANQVANQIDRQHGGLRGAPKFPQCGLLELLWRAGLRTGQTQFIGLVLLSLNRMCEGGLHDHLGGGFSRYCVDEAWLIPHFEKMLYDNAQILELLALAFQATGHRLFLDRAQQMVAWLEREMTTQDGAFCASLDADSEGHEGRFYVWTQAEIESVLGSEDAAFFARFYDVTPNGNWEGQVILNRSRAGEVSAEDEDRLAPLRTKLLAVRELRIRPGLDDKILADWNGLMIAALARAGALLQNQHWIGLAHRAYAAVMARMTHAKAPDLRLGHSYRDGRLMHPGLASDLAAMARAALALHEATGASDPLAQAQAMLETLERHHLDPTTGAYFLTADDAEPLIVRPSSSMDDSSPNYQAVAADALIRLAGLTGNDALRDRADRILIALSAMVAAHPLAHGALLNAIDTRLRLMEIVIVGPGQDRFAAPALTQPFLDRIVRRLEDTPTGDASDLDQALRHVAPSGGAAFVCAGGRCSPAVSDADVLSAHCAEMRVKTTPHNP